MTYHHEFEFVLPGGNTVKARRHVNPDGAPGGWVAANAEVDSSVVVEETAIIEPNAVVRPGVRVKAGTVVKSGTTLG